VIRRCVLSRNLVNEEALANWGLLPQKQTYMRLMDTGSDYGKFCIKEAVCQSVSVCNGVLPAGATPRVIDEETYELELLLREVVYLYKILILQSKDCIPKKF